MASRRAAVTCVSRSSMALRRAGGSSFSPSSSAALSFAFALPLPASELGGASDAAFSSTGFTAQARPGRASESVRASAVAPRRQLFVILVLIRPVLALERPVLLVIAHQPFELELGEHVRRVAPLAQ